MQNAKLNDDIHSQRVICDCGWKQAQNTCLKYALSTLGPHLSGLSIKKMEQLPQGYFQHCPGFRHL